MTKQSLKANEEERTILDKKVKIIGMLQNQKQLAAIGQLIGENKAGLLNNLISKGASTHEEDKKKFVGFMEDFYPIIMAIGSDIEEVERKVNEKVKEMKPSPEVKNPSSERVSEEGKGVS